MSNQTLTGYIGQLQNGVDETAFDRVSALPLSQWYERFGHIRNLGQNETLLRTLTKAEEKGIAFLKNENGSVNLFIKGDFPASSMNVTVPFDAPDLTIETEPSSEIERELGEKRIVFADTFHGYFINAAGETIEPSDEDDIGYGATTLTATMAVVDEEFEGYENFFGETIVTLGRGSKGPTL